MFENLFIDVEYCFLMNFIAWNLRMTSHLKPYRLRMLLAHFDVNLIYCYNTCGILSLKRLLILKWFTHKIIDIEDGSHSCFVHNDGVSLILDFIWHLNSFFILVSYQSETLCWIQLRSSLVEKMRKLLNISTLSSKVIWAGDSFWPAQWPQHSLTYLSTFVSQMFTFCHDIGSVSKFLHRTRHFIHPNAFFLY